METFLRSLLTLCGPGLHTPSRLKKEQAVMCYLDILNSLLPQDPNLLRPTLSHPDFHNENIFVNPENPSEITAILDWSSAEIAPLLVQAQPLRMIDYEGPQLEG
jgi:Ser/Thr protein kinase RdoA (MazF antagonist)